jgi:hypothetical protein
MVNLSIKQDWIGYADPLNGGLTQSLSTPPALTPFSFFGLGK